MTSFLNSHNLNILDNEFLSACFQETSVNDFQNNESDLAHRIPIAKLARNSIVNTNMTAPKALNSDKYKATSISESVGPFTPKEQSTDSSHHNNAESSCGLGSNASELDCRPLAPSFLPSVDDYSATSTDSALMEYNPDLSFCTSMPNRASSQSAMSGRYFETPPRLIDSQAATNKACMSAMPASSLAVRVPTPSSYKQKKPRSSYGDLKSYAKNFFSVKFEEPVWPPDVEAAFREALACVPKHGRCKIIVESSNGRTKPLGRNELISEYIFRKTGKYRSRKQVSSHIQVLKHMKVNDAQLRALLEDDNTTNSSADGIGKRSFFFPDCNQPIHPDRRYSEPTALRQERQQTSSPATDENGFLMPSSISCRSASFCAPIAQSRRSSSVSSNFEDHNKVLQQYIIPMPKSSPQYLEMNVPSSSNQDFKFSIETFSLKFIEKFNSVSRQFGCTDFLSSICSPERLYHGLANQQIHHPQFANVMSQFLGVIPIIVLKHMVKLPSVMESTHRSSLETVFRFSVLSECMSLTDYTLCSTEVYIRGQLQNSAEPVILQSFHQEQSDISLTPKVLLQLPLPCDFILRYFDYASSLPPLKQEAELNPRSSQEISQTTALKDLLIVQHLMPISEQNHTPSSTTAVVHTFDLLCLHDERAAWPMSEAFMFYAM